MARPAAFGPLLPANGLKGQLWIGSGFGDDSLRQGGVASTSEGELGCSDVPGYIDGTKSAANKGASVKPAEAKPVTQSTKSKDSKDSIDKDAILNEDGPLTDKASTKSTTDTAIDDGTDDYLYLSSTQTKASKSSDKLGTNTISDHADIQSLQEGAEIAGKVVLLSRGGCGFLEKVKWAQRRGAIALIVGDDVMGGPLIQMYARGDTSNVTIPAIFTSHTTAHLLSSLMGTDAFLEDLVDENGKPAIATQSKDKAKKGNKKLLNGGITQDAASKKATRGVTKISSKSTSAGNEAAPMNTQKPGWFSSWFFGSKGSKSDDRRPPSSGQLDWSLPNEAKEVDATSKKPSKSNEKDNTAKKPKEKTYTAKQAHGDDFQIGVQDWRDPDLVGSSKSSSKDKGSANDHKLPSTKAEEKLEAENAKTGASKLSSAGKKIKGNVQQDQSDHLQDLKGGSIVPSSGEYEVKSKDADKSSTKESQKDTSIVRPQSTGLWAKLFGSKHEEEVASPSSSSTTPSMEEQEAEISEEEDEMEGLWVTLTPTSGASPFLDTLLVLVVSPLVTLTVVYALLLIRSRIRRRRWRAPKSVVERLPVRTYQTIQTPGNRSPRLPPSPTAATVSTPLLQRGGNSRPRSRTTTGIPDSDLAMSTPLSVPIISPHVKEHESPISTSSEWRKFMGRQVECVVCLEEYIDGVSRVMSLPCGHEFHVDCMYVICPQSLLNPYPPSLLSQSPYS